MKNKLVFFGSSPFSIPVLEKLLNAQSGFAGSLYAVVTQPDKPVGRHLKLTPNPVKTLAQKHDILVVETINDLMTTNDNRMTGAVGLVAAYGQIIPQSVLDKFNGQIYNIHPSLLPKYRGPSPLQQQILDGVTETGVTIIQLDALMDHGSILIQENSQIYPDETTASLGEKLFTRGAHLFLNYLLSPNSYPLILQDHSQATYTKKLTRRDGWVDYAKFTSALATYPDWLDRMFRALHPWPGVWTLTPEGKRLKLIALKPQILVQLGGRTSQPWPIAV